MVTPLAYLSKVSWNFSEELNSWFPTISNVSEPIVNLVDVAIALPSNTLY